MQLSCFHSHRPGSPAPTPFPTPCQQGRLVCCPSKVEGSLSHMLQLVRGRANPLMACGQLSHLKGGLMADEAVLESSPGW